jgi:hypothetical protein
MSSASQIPDKFRSNIRAFNTISSQIMQLQLQLTQLRSQRDIIEEQLISDFTSNPELYNATINFQGSCISLGTENKYEALTYEFVKKCLSELLHDNVKAAEIIKAIKKMRKCDKIQFIKLISRANPIKSI